MSSISRISLPGSLLTVLLISLFTAQPLEAFGRHQLSNVAEFPAAMAIWNLSGNAVQDEASRTQDEESSRETSQSSKQQASITRARRNQLMKFVSENHPELKPLINSLRKKRPGQYNAAMRSLDKAVTRLNEIENTLTEERYNQVLNDWKLRSRIQLLSARLSIKDTPARRAELQRLITERIDNRVSQLNVEIEKAENRLDRLTQLVTELEANRNSEIERQFQLAVRAAERIKLNRQKKKKQANDSQQIDEKNLP